MYSDYQHTIKREAGEKDGETEKLKKGNKSAGEKAGELENLKTSKKPRKKPRK